MLSLQWVLLRNLPSPLGLPFEVRAVGLLVVAAGVVFFFKAVFAFKNHATTILPFEDDSQNLMVDGVFRVSRNPIYLGETIMLAGTCIMWGHAWPWLSVALFVVGIDRSVIRWEENALQHRFGSVYTEYRRRTRRWI